jgi:ribulose-phosphate 3-epimerase
MAGGVESAVRKRIAEFSSVRDVTAAAFGTHRVAAMSRRHHLVHLHHTAPAILPSLLLCDFGNLEREVARLEASGIAALHLDVMDGVFVPNLTYGMPIVAALRQLTSLPLDVHLMIANPRRYVAAFFEAGADIITVHCEAVDNPRAVLSEIRQLGAGAGIAINPQTPLEQLDGCWDACDVVLIMSVEAGFGGQAFQPIALDRLRAARQRAASDTLLAVDGGVNRETIHACAEAGADMFIVGSAIFRSREYGAAVADLRSLAQVN